MTPSPSASTPSPSPWVRRFSALLAPGASVLDVACGSGRHMCWFAQRGHPVTGVDRDPQALAAARAWGEVVEADIEGGPWPLPGRRFGCVVVTHYLWRPLLPAIVDSVAPGGVLLYETFAAGNETVGKPSRPDFLLQPGELLRACQGLRGVVWGAGFRGARARFVRRFGAVPTRAAVPATQPPPRHPLAAA